MDTQTQGINAILEERYTFNHKLSELKLAMDESMIIAVTDHRGKILEVNRKFCELSKYSKEELIGQDHRIINSGYHSKAFFADMWKTISNGNVWRGEIRNQTKEGKLYWVHTTIVPILDEHNQPYRYISIRVDITEQKQMEEELQKALKEDFNQTVKSMENGMFKMVRDDQGKFIYTMSEGKLMEKLGIGSHVL
jgi:PAS domain S-box-containing protein